MVTKLRWKKDGPVTGLAGVCAGPRGSKYHDGVDYYASTSCCTNGMWMWSAPSRDELGIEWKNSAADGIYFSDEKSAKYEAKRYVDSCIAKHMENIK